MIKDGQELCTSDKILYAAIDLMAEKGYRGVSTKEIAAAAGLSEMTLFRRFGSKQNLLEAAVDRFHYGPEMKKLFSERIVWSLHRDLITISNVYHEIMLRNRNMFLITFKEGHLLPEAKERMLKHPVQLKELLTDYFTRMQELGLLVRDEPPEPLALAFMHLNYGAFVSFVTNGKTIGQSTLAETIEAGVRTFVRGLTP